MEQGHADHILALQQIIEKDTNVGKKGCYILIVLEKIRVVHDRNEACLRINGKFNIEQGIKHG